MAVNVAVEPIQIVALFTDTIGNGITVTVLVEGIKIQLPVAPVTV